jgi:hypothetical protein
MCRYPHGQRLPTRPVGADRPTGVATPTTAGPQPIDAVAQPAGIRSDRSGIKKHPGSQAA